LIPIPTYHEQGDSLYSNVEEKEAKSAKVVGDVQHGALDVAHLSLLVLISSSLDDKSLCSNHSLAFGQKPAVLGVGGQQVG